MPFAPRPIPVPVPGLQPASEYVAFAWSELPSLPARIGEVASVLLDDCIFAVGEKNPATFKYNLANGRNGTWETVASRPFVGHHHAMVTFGGEMFIIGGLGRGGSKVQSYNPSSNRWSVAYPSIPYGPRLGSVSAAVFNERIAVCGGLDDDIGGNMLKCSALDPLARVWTPFADMLVGVNHQAAGTDGEKFYIFGGRVEETNRPGNGISTLQIYDPATIKAKWLASV